MRITLFEATSNVKQEVFFSLQMVRKNEDKKTLCRCPTIEKHFPETYDISWNTYFSHRSIDTFSSNSG